MSLNCSVACVSDGNAQRQKRRMSRGHTNPDECNEWSRSICRGEKEVDLVPLGHCIYDMCLAKLPVNISPWSTRMQEAET